MGQLGFVTKPEMIQYVTISLIVGYSLIPYKYPSGILMQITLSLSSPFSFMDML